MIENYKKSNIIKIIKFVKLIYMKVNLYEKLYTDEKIYCNYFIINFN
jgi:hypothetical protein